MPTATELVDELLDGLRPLGTPQRAEGERRYLKSALTHLGVPMPEIRATVRGFVRAHPDLDGAARTQLVVELWRREIFELRQVAVQLLEHGRSELDASALDLLERLLRDAHTWALVDPLAIGVAGWIARHDERVWDRLDVWIVDGDVWVRRAALLAHLPSLKTDSAMFGHFAGYADAVLDEREFFIRKAIGWVLREVGKRDPASVVAWLEPRLRRASGVTVREAVKYLPDGDRARLLAAYRRGHPR